MELTVLHTGPFAVNTLIVPLCGAHVLVVDPAACAYSGDEGAITAHLAERRLEPAAFILTHGHFDHVSGLGALRAAYPGAPVAIHRADAALIGADSARAQGASLAPMGFGEFLPFVSGLPEPTHFLDDGALLSDTFAGAPGIDGDVRAALAGWRVLHTPGHTPGSVCLYNEGAHTLISGDTLFYRSWGRTDLPGGSERHIQQSLRRLAQTVDADTAVYPGHDRYGFTMAENFL